RGGHHRRAEPLAAVVGAEPACEEAVAVGVVDDVARPRAGARERTRHELGPGGEVAPGVAHDGRLAGGARGGVDPRNLPAWPGKKAERIVIAQVALRHEG